MKFSLEQVVFPDNFFQTPKENKYSDQSLKCYDNLTINLPSFNSYFNNSNKLDNSDFRTLPAKIIPT